MVHQVEVQDRTDPAAAFARLWSGIVSKTPSLQRVDLTPPGHTMAMTHTLPAKGNRAEAAIFDKKAKEAHEWLDGQRTTALPPLLQQRNMGAEMRTMYVVPQPRLDEQGKSAHSASGVDAANAAVASSLGYKLNEEDLALAEACLDGLAEEDGPGRSLHREREAAAKAVQRLGVDSTNEGAHLLLSLLGPLGLGGDNISPAQMKALLEAMGSSPQDLQRRSQESLRQMLRAQLLGEVPSPRTEPPQPVERSDLWPEGRRQPPRGGCATLYANQPPWDLSRHQVPPARPRSLFARDIMPVSKSLCSSASMPNMPNCDVLAKASNPANNQQSFQSDKSLRKKPAAVPTLDTVVSCKTLKTRERELQTTGWHPEAYGNRSKRHLRPAKIRYGDRRLPPILVEVR